MELSPASLDGLFFGYDTRYSEGYKRAETFWQKVCQESPTIGRETRYAWLDQIPQMRERVGERQMRNISLRAFSVVNKNYEDTVRVPVDDIKDDQYGTYAPMIEMLGRAAKILPDRLTSDLLRLGDSSVCFDGQYFFDTDHPLDIDNPGAGTQSNLLTSTPLSAASYRTARAKMRGLKGRDGAPLGVIPNLLMVPTNLEGVGREILNADFIANAAGTAAPSNVFVGSAELVVNPYLPDDDWYLFDTTMPVKALVHQTREPAKLVPLVDPTSPNVFFQKEFIWGVESREACGYGLWFLAMKGRANS